MEDKIYDVVILGGGPAGLSAAIYACRAKLETMIIEKGDFGGEILKTSRVDNYPGGITGESGAELIARMKQQAESFGCEFISDNIAMVNLGDDKESGKAIEVKTIVGLKGLYKSKALIIATGHGPGDIPKPLGIKGEEDFTGAGVSYCATCDAAFFTDSVIIAICEDKHALEEAMYLEDFASKLYLITSKSRLTSDKELIEKAESSEKIEILLDTSVQEIRGIGIVNAVETKNRKTGEISIISAELKDGTMGVFIFAGNFPQTKMFEGRIDMEDGYIITDEEMRTNYPGVYAAGDVRKKTLRQLVTAAADGAIAATSAKKDIKII